MADQLTQGLERADQRTVLSAFSRGLDREAHNLAQWPNLLWQQFYNRLQWEDGALPHVLAPEWARRTAPGALPWLSTRTKFREANALVRTIPAHATSIALSPDGRFIVSVSISAGADSAQFVPNRNTLKIWDVATGKERATLTGHTGNIQNCAISPDSQFIVSMSDDKTLKIWDAASGSEHATLTDHTGNIQDCAISPDSQFVVSASEDGTLKIWDTATGAERATLTGHTKGVRACAVSPDGGFIVSASADRTLKIWDAGSGRERATLTGHTESILSCTISPDGRFIVVWSGNRWIIDSDDRYDAALSIWDTATAEQRGTLTGSTERRSIGPFAISPADGNFIVSSIDSNVLKIWDAATGTERATLTGHAGKI